MLGRALLEPGDQEILELRSDEEMPFAHIAAKLRIDESAAKKRYARAVLRLARWMGRLREGNTDELVRELRRGTG